MIALNKLFLAPYASPKTQAKNSNFGSVNKSENSDGFASMFQKASDSSRTSDAPHGFPDRIRQEKSQQSRETQPIEEKLSEDQPVDEKLPEDQLFEENPLKDADEDKTEVIPDEMLALAATVIPPIIQDQTAEPAGEAKSDQIAIPQTDSAVVSSLESNKDIDVPVKEEVVTGQQPVVTTETSTPEQTARMPQTPGQTEIPEEDVKAGAKNEQADTIAPCPLENENNTPRNETGNMPSKRDDQQEKPQQNTRVFGESQPVDISPERLLATEQLSQTAETAAPQTATAETLYDTLVDSIFTQSTSESKFMEIQLKPEFLGKVAIQLTLGDSGLEIKIKADDAGVKGLIADQITQLTASLSDKGVKVAAVEVVYTNVTDHSYDGSNHHRHDTRQSENSSYRDMNVGFGIGFTDDAEDGVSIVDTGVASVEYRV